MIFNEDSRVKIPALLHLSRLGYSYLSLKGAKIDEASNIFPELFSSSLQAINPSATADDIDRLHKKISLLLGNEDLGKAFYELLTATSGLKLIDFENFDRNSFHVVTELTYKNGEEEFRPDITLLINGMPLGFIEVKKPNNPEGIRAERERIHVRSMNPKFRRFFNITQLMMFSNNMEYENDTTEPLAGAFYACSSYDKPTFNFFREEDSSISRWLTPENAEVEDLILTDNNLVSIKHSPEFASNKEIDTPTHRIITSLFSRERLAFLLRFAFAYVRVKSDTGEDRGIQKHIMRYPQVFATLAIANSLEKGVRKGIIWHTQGSGKTALAYYNVQHLTAHFQRQGVIPKFYFIVDRIDLLNQASDEFKSRGLVVHKIDSRDAFTKDIKSTKAIHNNAGKPEITVINIQKFKDEPDVVSPADYNIQLQRIYFLDEVHRSYNPKGSFLANLNESDTQAIKIGLTGTPLIGESASSKALFGDYIHKYYYNQSVADGYTLRLIREEIETRYKLGFAQALEGIEVLKNSEKRETLYAHRKFVEPMLDYIVADFGDFRLRHGDGSTGAMVICDSAKQAKMMSEIFAEKYESHASVAEPVAEYLKVAEDVAPYRFTSTLDRSVRKQALILHDVGTKEERKHWVDDFKDGKIDILFVYNMLLTGFDAPRLKKLYLGRMVKAHNLLQALTRVNRTYNGYQYGHVVDFADIQTEFDKTNQAYFNELQSVLGEELPHFSDLFKSDSEVAAEIDAIKDALCRFDIGNVEIFSQQINQIQDRQQLWPILKALGDAKILRNLIRTFGARELLGLLDVQNLNSLYTEANNRFALLKVKEECENGVSNLNVALEDVIFAFHQVSTGEMRMADELKDTLRRTREGLLGNFDPRDPEFVSLREELERLFQKKNLTEISQEEMSANIAALNDIQDRARELERKNQLLRAKYANDAKYARIHKRLLEKGEPTPDERKLFEVLAAFKERADAMISQNTQLLTNPAFAEGEMHRMILNQFKAQLPLTVESSLFIKNLVMNEYLDEFKGQQPA
jgi:type I restriction enzyme R subunit